MPDEPVKLKGLRREIDRDEFEEQYHRMGIRIKKDLADEVKEYIKKYNATHADRMTVNSLVTELLEREIKK